MLAGCGATSQGVVEVSSGQYWIHAPDSDSERRPALVFLHATGRGYDLIEDESLLADYDNEGLIAVFPDGWGAPEDDWNVGNNRDDIEREDHLFLAEVAASLRERSDVSDLWLAGFSKGGAMAYKMACQGDDSFDGYLPTAGAWEKPEPANGCVTQPRPIEHTQGRDDDRWPLHEASNPDSSHHGIIESLGLLPATDATCLDSPVTEGDCTVWPACSVDVRLCMFDGGHSSPPNQVGRYRTAIDRWR